MCVCEPVSNQCLCQMLLRESLGGIRMRLQVTVVNISASSTTCVPIPNAVVDIWHCNAVGDYSHFVTGAVSDSE
jgi:protocatechuate 3,4-dioxygenase beta subunit